MEFNNSKIAKNTLFMYMRMFITMSINLYASRVVLNTLGFEDYGLYNVIGGIIAMIGFINGAMTNTTLRYITFYMGKDDGQTLNKVFSMSFITHLIVALVTIVLGETVGLWYLYEKLVVPEGRFFAAFWLYQLSIASTVVSILYTPFNAVIIAHEKMSAFAYISILDAFLKLIIIFAIVVAPFDKLIFYGTLMFFVSIVDITIYSVYCSTHFQETKIHWFWDKNRFREMFGFASWSLLGNFSYVFFNQGINLILNAFCGPSVNAARGIAVQVDSVIKQFASNVQTAINPQIIKSYAEKNVDRMYSLIFASSRLCFYLLLVLSLPVMIEADYILSIWLGNVPSHTVNFIRITLANVILDALVNPMFTSNLATGRVRIYQITISVICYCFMPLTYLSIKIFHVPESVFLCVLLCSLLSLVARIFIIRNQIGLPIPLYFQKVVKPVFLVVVSSVILPIYLYHRMNEGFFDFLLVFVVCVCSVVSCSFLFGFERKERLSMIKLIRKKINI